MNVPPPLLGESVKAHKAFAIYCEVGGSTTKVARKLACSRQNIDKWFSKFDWKRRFNALRQRECEQKIAAEQQAVEKVAEVTELERARAARKTFEVAERFVNHADKIVEQHPLAAARLFAVGKDITEGVGGTSRNYHVDVSVQRKFPTMGFDQSGAPIEMPMIESYERALEITAESEKTLPKELPCDGWSPESPDATPIPEPGEFVEDIKDVVLAVVPSRVGPGEMPNGIDPRAPTRR